MNVVDLRAVIAKAAYDIFDPAEHNRIATVFSQPDFQFDLLTDSSLILTELCFQVEEALGIEIETADLFDNPSLSEFIERIESKLAKV
jgi:acyl carrier protein